MSCPRLFEAEASRDGRLEGAERASFERHVATCGECKAEVSALAELATLARARPADVDELRAPRGRLRLIGAYNHELTEPAPTRRVWLPLVAAAAVVALGLGAQRVLSGPSLRPTVTAEPEVRPAAPLATVATTASMTPVPVAPSITTAPPVRVPVADPDDDYRSALAKLETGDDHAAAAAFERFVARYPRHVHAEDAAYLRVIALQHAGDRPAMQAAAATYLAAYPNGFRAKEVEERVR